VLPDLPSAKLLIMPLVVAFLVMGLAFLLLIRYERQKKLQSKDLEANLQAMDDGATYGGLVGQAHMANLGVEPDPVTRREDTEFKKFKFD
jgi:preprotein translocase subunit YajC